MTAGDQAMLMRVDRRARALPRRSRFDDLARWTERQAGRSLSFGAAAFLVAAWAVSGPLLGWSDTWQLIINTATTIVTFLMVFLIQNTHYRDIKALNLKVDELIRVSGASPSLIAIEELSDAEIDRLRDTASGYAPVETVGKSRASDGRSGWPA